MFFSGDLSMYKYLEFLDEICGMKKNGSYGNHSIFVWVFVLTSLAFNLVVFPKKYVQWTCSTRWKISGHDFPTSGCPDVQKVLPKGRKRPWDFSEVAATQPARPKTRTPGLGRCLLNTGLGQCFVLFIFMFISKGQFHGKKTPKKKAREKMYFGKGIKPKKWPTKSGYGIGSWFAQHPRRPIDIAEKMPEKGPNFERFSTPTPPAWPGAFSVE